MAFQFVVEIGSAVREWRKASHRRRVDRHLLSIAKRRRAMATLDWEAREFLDEDLSDWLTLQREALDKEEQNALKVLESLN
jgi:hypothetical protein